MKISDILTTLSVFAMVLASISGTLTYYGVLVTTQKIWVALPIALVVDLLFFGFVTRAMTKLYSYNKTGVYVYFMAAIVLALVSGTSGMWAISSQKKDKVEQIVSTATKFASSTKRYQSPKIDYINTNSTLSGVLDKPTRKQLRAWVFTGQSNWASKTPKLARFRSKLRKAYRKDIKAYDQSKQEIARLNTVSIKDAENKSKMLSLLGSSVKATTSFLNIFNVANFVVIILQFFVAFIIAYVSFIERKPINEIKNPAMLIVSSVVSVVNWVTTIGEIALNRVGLLFNSGFLVDINGDGVIGFRSNNSNEQDRYNRNKRNNRKNKKEKSVTNVTGDTNVSPTPPSFFDTNKAKALVFTGDTGDTVDTFVTPTDTSVTGDTIVSDTSVTGDKMYHNITNQGTLRNYRARGLRRKNLKMFVNATVRLAELQGKYTARTRSNAVLEFKSKI